MIQAAQNEAPPAAEAFLACFDRLEREGFGRQAPWVFPQRKAGIARFAELGFPTVEHEDWRFTNVAPLLALPLRPLLDSAPVIPSKAALEPLVFAGLAGPRLVFVDGYFAPALSDLAGLPPGVTATGLAHAMADGAPLLEKHLGRQSAATENAFAALNNAFFTDGAFLHVPAGTVVEQPVQVVHLSTGREAGATTHPRMLIVAERQSRLTVLETWAVLGEAPYFNNAVTEMVVGDEARVEHLKFQDEAPQAFHIASLHASFGRACHVSSHSFALGARLSRNDIRARLDGDGLECVLNGLYLTKDDQLADHHMVVEHARPHCASHEYFNGILADRSKGVFHGRILVRREGQKTDAKQTNKNLLLSDEATADTKPQLEIYADDVKCTHGATVGQMNDEAIFYLRARGIGLETARRMLMHAFAGEIIERVQHEAAREALDRLVWDRLEAMPALAGKG